MKQPNALPLPGRSSSIRVPCCCLYWLCMICSNIASFMKYVPGNVVLFALGFGFAWIGFGPDGRSPNAPASATEGRP
jgi:hypothetical protein